MTGLMFFDLEEASNQMNRGFRRQRPKSTWRWQRRTGAGSRFQLQPRNERAADENDTAIRALEHLQYLKRMASDGVVSQSLTTKAKTIWWVAQASVGSALPVPAAAAFSGGPVEYHWSVGPHQLSAEIPADGPCHWTYRNVNTGELWGVETADEGLPPKLIRALTRIAASSN